MDSINDYHRAYFVVGVGPIVGSDEQSGDYPFSWPLLFTLLSVWLGRERASKERRLLLLALLGIVVVQFDTWSITGVNQDRDTHEWLGYWRCWQLQYYLL